MAAEGTSDATLVYASWNGATAVAAWEVLDGTDPSDLRPIGIAKNAGFETIIHAAPGPSYVLARALDVHGNELGRSPLTELDPGV